jgi:predicted NBD/HSP70 family sugar kinase
MSAKPRSAPRRILVLDIGGSHVKARISGAPDEVRFVSGPSMTPARMARTLRQRIPVASYDVVTIGYPGIVRRGRILREPRHLGAGWIAFDFRKALGRPIRILNDAAMQALGSYEGGRMLFLGLGTGLGSAMIVEGKVAPMELAHLPFKKSRTYEQFVGEEALLRLGKKRWRREVARVVAQLSEALEPDYVVLGGGNLRKLGDLPTGSRPGDNENAFLGGVRAWGEHREAEHGPAGRPSGPRRHPSDQP